MSGGFQVLPIFIIILIVIVIGIAAFSQKRQHGKSDSTKAVFRDNQIQRCPHCGGETEPDAVYCTHCGKSLA
jgi:uncharacterized membrane protein YvbJ